MFMLIFSSEKVDARVHKTDFLKLDKGPSTGKSYPFVLWVRNKQNLNIEESLHLAIQLDAERRLLQAITLHDNLIKLVEINPFLDDLVYGAFFIRKAQV